MTKAELKHINRVARIGCIVCYRLGYGATPAEIHHVRKNGEKRKHMKVLSLCPEHHRNGGYGVAFHAGQKTWEENYGTEEELLEVVNILILGKAEF